MLRRSFLKKTAAFGAIPLGAVSSERSKPEWYSPICCPVNWQIPNEADKIITKIDLNPMRMAGSSDWPWDLTKIDGLPTYENRVFLVFGIAVPPIEDGKITGWLNLGLHSAGPEEDQPRRGKLSSNHFLNKSLLTVSGDNFSIIKQHLGESVDFLDIERFPNQKEEGWKVRFNNVTFDYSSIAIIPVVWGVNRPNFTVRFEALGIEEI